MMMLSSTPSKGYKTTRTHCSSKRASHTSATCSRKIRRFRILLQFFIINYNLINNQHLTGLWQEDHHVLGLIRPQSQQQHRSRHGLLLHAFSTHISHTTNAGDLATGDAAGWLVHAHICNLPDVCAIVVCMHDDVRGHANDPGQPQL